MPSENENIVSIEEDRQGIIVSNGKRCFIIKDGKVKPTNHNYSPNKQTSTTQLSELDIPQASQILKKPQELISTIFKDASGNLWVGYRNAGYQVISRNAVLYSLANQNPLSEATQGMDITCLTTAGQKIFAGTTLRLFVYDTQSKHQNYTYYKDIFKDSVPNKQALINIIDMGQEDICLIGNHEIVFANISSGKLSITERAPILKQLGIGTRLGKDIYTSCKSPYIIRCKLNPHRKEYDKAEHGEIEYIPISSPWYDEETQLTTLRNGDILLFMKDMHVALFSPKTEKCQEIQLQGIGETHNIDPAFARQDSQGNIWLGTKRSGLYRMSLKDKKAERMNFVNDVHIQALLEDRRGQLWITTLKDATCYQPSTGAVLMNSLVSSSQNEWNRQYFDNSISLSPNSDIILGSSDGCIFLPSSSGDKDLASNKSDRSGKFVSHDNMTSLEKGLCIYNIDVKTQEGDALNINNYSSFDNLGDGSQIKETRHYTFAHDENTLMDSDKLEKIMSNLFTNALKHTPKNGSICISATLTTSPSDMNREASLEVSIFNSGSHIDEDKLQDVFKRYYQLDETQNEHHYGWGTGIGLYYVKRLVGLHHGEIEVRNIAKSIPQKTDMKTAQVKESGVEFRFSLPIHKDIYKNSELSEERTQVMQIPLDSHLEGASIEDNFTSSTTASEKRALSNEDDKRTKILVVDDDIDVAQYIRSIFANDYIVENRYSAEEALADLESIAPDIILSDIIMGKMSGYEFCKTLKSNLLFSHIPVILITAKSNTDEQITGLRLGAVAYITKPFDPFYLRAAVEAQLSNMQTLRQRLGESTDTESLTQAVADTMSEQDRKFMDELYGLMEKRAAELDLNATTICHDLLISQSKFTYKLKELTSDTPGTFFRKYKLNKAAQLLKEGKHNISEISVMTGFSTAEQYPCIDTERVSQWQHGYDHSSLRVDEHRHKEESNSYRPRIRLHQVCEQSLNLWQIIGKISITHPCDTIDGYHCHHTILPNSTCHCGLCLSLAEDNHQGSRRYHSNLDDNVHRQWFHHHATILQGLWIRRKQVDAHHACHRDDNHKSQCHQEDIYGTLALWSYLFVEGSCRVTIDICFLSWVLQLLQELRVLVKVETTMPTHCHSTQDTNKTSRDGDKDNLHIAHMEAMLDADGRESHDGSCDWRTGNTYLRGYAGDAARVLWTNAFLQGDITDDRHERVNHMSCSHQDGKSDTRDGTQCQRTITRTYPQGQQHNE